MVLMTQGSLASSSVTCTLVDPPILPTPRPKPDGTATPGQAAGATERVLEGVGALSANGAEVQVVEADGLLIGPVASDGAGSTNVCEWAPDYCVCRSCFAPIA